MPDTLRPAGQPRGQAPGTVPPVRSAPRRRAAPLAARSQQAAIEPNSSSCGGVQPPLPPLPPPPSQPPIPPMSERLFVFFVLSLWQRSHSRYARAVAAVSPSSGLRLRTHRCTPIMHKNLHRHAPRATGTVKACALAPLDFCGLESHGRSFPRSSGIGGRPRRAATPTRSGGHLRVWTRSGESDSGAVCHRPCHAVEAGDHGLGPRSSGSLRGVANGSTCALLRAFSIGSPDSRPMLDCPRRLHTNTAASTAMAVRIGPPDEWPSFAAVRTY